MLSLAGEIPTRETARGLDMHFDELGNEGDDYEDVDTQYMIEQSLLECNKQIGSRDSILGDECRYTASCFTLVNL